MNYQPERRLVGHYKAHGFSVERWDAVASDSRRESIGIIERVGNFGFSLLDIADARPDLTYSPSRLTRILKVTGTALVVAAIFGNLAVARIGREESAPDI